MRQLFPSSSRERRREGKREELREEHCIVSSSECSKWWHFFLFFFLFSAGRNRTRGRTGEKSTDWKGWSCCQRETKKKEHQKRRRRRRRRKGIAVERQQWIAEGLSLTLRWPRFARCCWRQSSTHTRLLTSAR